MKTIPQKLPIKPITVPCPRCKAKPGQDCGDSGSFPLVHVERIAAAAKKDRAKRSCR